MDKRIFARIRRLHWCADQAMSDGLSRMDLTASQGCAMGFLNHQKAPPMAKDFEEALHLSHASASGILSRLEKKGFIEFRPDEEDRRCKRIYMLPKAQNCHEHMHGIMVGLEETITQDFTSQEREQFLQYLDRAIANLDKEVHTSHD